MAASVLFRGAGWDALFLRGLEAYQQRGTITDHYSQVGAVYLAISIVSQSLASVPFVFKRGKEKLDKHPLTTLLGPAVFEATTIFLENRGEAYWLLDQEAGTAASDGRIRFPRRIRMLHPKHVQPKVKSGELVGWEYQPLLGGAKTFSLEQVVDFRYFDPEHPFKGLAPLKAAMLTSSLNWKGKKFQDLFYENGAMPPFYVKVPLEAGDMDEAEQDIARAKFNDEHTGLPRAWTIPFLFGGSSLETVVVNQKEQQWLETNRHTIYEILAIFQVPAFFAGLPESREARAVEARRGFWTRPIRAKGTLIAERINKQLVTPYFPADVFEWDFRAKMAEVLPEDVHASITAAAALIDRGLPPVKAYQALGLEIDTDGEPQLEVGWISTTLTPAAIAMEGPPDPPPSPGGGQEDDDEDAGARAVRIAGRAMRKRHLGRGWPKGEQLRAALWRAVTSGADKAERRMLGDYRGVLAWLRDQVLANLAELDRGLAMGPGMRKLIARSLADDVLPPDGEFERVMREDMAPSIEGSARAGWDAVMAEVGADLSFNVLDPMVVQLLAARTVKIVGTTETRAEEIRQAIANGVEEGESITKLAERIRQLHNDQYKNQAVTVARTETLGAFDGAREIAMEQAGVNGREWLSARDGRVRESHEAVDGEIIVYGDTFTNGLHHPHDPAGSAGETINCRCVALPVILETGQSIRRVTKGRSRIYLPVMREAA